MIAELILGLKIVLFQVHHSYVLNVIQQTCYSYSIPCLHSSSVSRNFPYFSFQIIHSVCLLYPTS